MNSMQLCVYFIPQPKNYAKCKFMLLFHMVNIHFFHSHGTILATKQKSQSKATKGQEIEEISKNSTEAKATDNDEKIKKSPKETKLTEQEH